MNRAYVFYSGMTIGVIIGSVGMVAILAIIGTKLRRDRDRWEQF